MTEERRKWKILVIADETPEFERVLRLATLRVARVGGSIAMLHITPPGDFQHWMSVRELMEEEARQHAEELLDGFRKKIHELAPIEIETEIRLGEYKEVIMDYIQEHDDVSMLALGANVGSGDPGPIIKAFREELLAVLHMPVLVVPGNLTDEDIDHFV